MFHKIRKLRNIAASAIIAVACLSFGVFAQVSIVVNNVGYESTGTKRAIVQSAGSIAATSFDIVNSSGTSVHTGTLGAQQKSAQWSGDTFGNFKVADFSEFTAAGEYRVKVGEATSASFSIDEKVLQKKTGADQVGFFKAMRHTESGFGDDRELPVYGGSRKVDLYGGWWDATGDPGKHLSHLTYSNYFTPQQIPMVVWALLHAVDAQPSVFGAAAKEEAAWGADYLLRSLSPEGYFYMSVFDNWGDGYKWVDRDQQGAGTRGEREICNWGNSAGIEELLDGTFNSIGLRSGTYQSALREGGGVSIAALARAAKTGISGDYMAAQYLAGAKRAYEHLVYDGNYKTYADDGVPNIIDFYTGLLAATELYAATDEYEYLDEARRWVDSLLSLQSDDGWFYSGNDTKGRGRPFYHAAEEGFPVVALSRFDQVSVAAGQWSRVGDARAAVGKNLRWYGEITRNQIYGTNPFEYARMWRAKGAGANIDVGGKYVVHVEAENFDSKYGDFRTETEGGRTSIGYISNGDFATYKFVAEVEDAYTLEFMAASGFENGSSFTVTVNSSSPMDVSIANDGWSVFKAVKLSANVQLRQGENTIRLDFKSPVNVDYFRFVSVNKEIEAPPPGDNGAYFFIPKVNETGYWWQGENARLASMASAFIMGAPMVTNTVLMWNDTLKSMATSQLDWILGKNPLNLCMMYGHGPEKGGEYPHYERATQHLKNIKGGICNGISSSRDKNEENIEFMPHDMNGEQWYYNWRYVEQWLPHNAWYLVAISSMSHRIDNPIVGEVISVSHTRASKQTRMNVSVSRGRHLRVELPFAASPRTEVVMYNMQGRKVFSHKMTEGSRSVSLKVPAKIARGTYVLSVRDRAGKNIAASRVLLR